MGARLFPVGKLRMLRFLPVNMIPEEALKEFPTAIYI